MITLLIFCLILAGGDNVFAREETKTNGLLTYSPQVQVRLVRPITAGSLSGIVIDSEGFPIPDALVERVNHTWEATFDERKTDSNGRFSFGKMPKGRYFLKASKLGFNTLVLKVRTTNKSKAKLKLSLRVSQ